MKKKKSNIIYMVKTKLKKLTKDQKNKLEKHKVHHTDKHMKSMRMMMMRGVSFEEAHKNAMKKFGK